MESSVLPSRIRTGDVPLRQDGELVLYWMTAYRRPGWNFSLQRAVEWARELKKPLVIVESLGAGGRWESARHHAFALGGMAENARHFAKTSAHYYPFVAQSPQAAGEFLDALARRACLVVADDFPIPGDEPSGIAQTVCVEWIDSNGLSPLAVADHAFPTAFAFRRFLQKTLREHLLDLPEADPLAGVKLSRLKSLGTKITERWPAASAELLQAHTTTLARLPINHTIAPAALSGGPMAAQERWRDFLRHRLSAYGEGRNHPDDDAASGLSPYLHFGHISVQQIFCELTHSERWSPERLAEKATGGREGWWGMKDSAEAFLDELVTWREIGFNMCRQNPHGFDQYESLPDWARKTLDRHAKDARETVYSLEQFAAAQTHDFLWNAAQRELTRTGRIQNYLRMLWGKKILEWSATPRDALGVMIELNNRYALDGCDPNSYSGIFWVLGRYDRAWGPERPIFGTIRYMSSENTARKLRLKKYLETYGAR